MLSFVVSMCLCWVFSFCRIVFYGKFGYFFFIFCVDLIIIWLFCKVERFFLILWRCWFFVVRFRLEVLKSCSKVCSCWMFLCVLCMDLWMLLFGYSVVVIVEYLCCVNLSVFVLIVLIGIFMFLEIV